MNKTIVKIRGMHCKSCELLIEDKLKENPDIKNVSVNYKKAEAWIYSHHPLKISEVEKAVREAGYEVGVESKSWFSKDFSDYADILLAFAAITVLYAIIKNSGIADKIGGISTNGNLLVVLIVGLTAGISTCMALVGGLILGLTSRFAEKHPEATTGAKIRPVLFFMIGRIVSYFLLGGLIGLVGKAFQLSSGFLGALMIIVGIVMMVLGIQLTEISPKISSGGITLPSGISKFLGFKKHQEKEYNHFNSALLGALTFFLPCGFTQAMQLYAVSTGSFWSGALIMATFALGTAPGLMGIGGISSLFKGSWSKKFFKFAGLLVIIFAIINISNGYSLTGWKGISLKTSSTGVGSKNSAAAATVENGVQVVRMDQLAGSYSPNQFTVKVGIPVKWIITSKADTCAASISMPGMNIRKSLNPGENIIEFTPTKTGELKFSCLMGMYRGKFIVEAK